MTAWRRQLIVVSVVSYFLLTPLALASKFEEVALAFTPTEDLESVVVSIQLMETPVNFRLTDGRSVPSPLVVGEQIDGYQWRATLDPVVTLAPIARSILSDWSIPLAPEAPLTLDLDLTRYYVTEEEGFWASDYVADVAIGAALSASDGTTLWKGTVRSESRVIGKERNPENCNEVLSNALQSVLARLIGNDGLQQAWRVKAPAADSRTPMQPSEMLTALKRLAGSGVGEDVMVGFARHHSLASALSVDDVLEWKNEGIPEKVIAAAMDGGGESRTKPEQPSR